ncbi:MAG: DUF1430 domain-containing protein [Firmicutes bacterium]|nr:DUF1430 domain-containing protein [Bacillota bacterium]
MNFKLISLKDINSNNLTQISVSAWEAECSVENKLDQIHQFAEKNNINFFKLEHEISDINIMKLCYAVGAKTKFEKRMLGILRLSDGNSLTRFDKGKFFANKDLNDINQIGFLNIFFSDDLVKITDIKDSNSVLGTYLFENEDIKNKSTLIDEFVLKMGFEHNKPSSGDISIITGLFYILIVILAFFFSIYVATYIYYVVKNYSQIAICKMLGWSNFSIIKFIMLRFVIPVNIVACLISIVISSIHMFFYNRYKQFFEYIFACLKSSLIIMTVILLVSCFIFYIGSKYVNINMMIADKKPVKFVQIINTVVKFFVVMTTCVLLLYCTNNVYISSKSKYSLEKIKESNGYVVYDIDSMYNNMWQRLNGNISKKLKELFYLENRRSCILSYIGANSFKENFDTISDVTHMFVNTSYLNKNPVYDLNNQKISFESEYGNFMNVLVPEKYKKLEEKLFEIILDWKENQCYIENRISEMSNSYVRQNLSTERNSIKITYIKNKQNLCTYEIEKLYVEEPIVFVVNSENVSKDMIFSFFITKHVFIDPGQDIKDAYNYLKPNLEKCDLLQEILSVESLLSKNSSYLKLIKDQINYTSIILILFFLSIAVVIFFITINYTERNKFVNSIKKLHGYTFFERHYVYFMENISLYVVVFIGLTVLKKMSEGLVRDVPISYFCFISLITLFLYTFDSIFSYIFIKMAENNKIKEIIKGE